MLNAADPDALIAVFDESRVTFYGAQGKAFRLETKEQLDRQPYKIDGKDPVSDVVIKTFVNSPACQYIRIAGGPYWYPAGCPL